MPRSPGGDYSLPEGQPVEPNTVIESDVHNSLANDLAEEITDSLSRTGKGGMLVPFRTIDGTPAYPGFSFSSANNAGMSYEPSSRFLQFSSEGILSFIVKADGVESKHRHTSPIFIGTSEDVATPTSTSHALTAGDTTEKCVKIGMNGIQGVDQELPSELNLNAAGGDVLLNGEKLSTDVFETGEFINTSSGTPDAGKPVVLNGSGRIDDTMIEVTAYTFIGTWTPSTGAEYPDTTGIDPGGFWTVDGLTADYTFQTGDLASQIATNDSVMILSSTGFVMTTASLDPDTYYRLDGSFPLTADFAGGGQKLTNIADGVADTDAATVGQLGSGSFLPIDGKAVDSDKLDGLDSTQFAPVAHVHDDLYFTESEFINRSDGVADAGKPILLDSNGLVSATMLNVSSFVFQGTFTPAAGAEYPSSVGLDPGAFWTVDGMANDYTFTGGDLAGETITNDDLMIWGTEGWAMTHSDNDMSVYYKLDGSRPLAGDMNAGGNAITLVAESTYNTSVATVGQLNRIALAVDGSNIMEAPVEIKGDNDDSTVKFIRPDDTVRGVVGATEDTEVLVFRLLDSGGVSSAAEIALTDDGNATLTDFTDATEDNHIVTKKWVEDNIGGGNFLPIDGSENMTGTLKVEAAGVANSFQLVGAAGATQFEITSSPSVDYAVFRLHDSVGNPVNTIAIKSNGNFELINFNEATLSANDVVTKEWVENYGGSGEDFVKVNGTSIMTAPLKIQGVGIGNNGIILNRSNGTSVARVYCDESNENVVLRSYDSSMQISASLIALADGNIRAEKFVAPAHNNDLVTKKWVEDNIGGTGNEIFFDYDGASQTIIKSQNVSGIVHVSTGTYRITFANSMPDVGYYVTGGAGGGGSDDAESFFNIGDRSMMTTSAFDCRSVYAADNSASSDTEVVFGRVIHPNYTGVSIDEAAPVSNMIGVVQNFDNTIQIVVPAKGYTVQDNFNRLGITNGSIMNRGKLPTSSILRDAWRLDEVANTIYIDLARAKEIVIALNEAVVDDQLKAIRPAFEEAYDADDLTALSLIKSDRQNIRNTLATKISNINACATVASVEAYLP